MGRQGWRQGIRIPEKQAEALEALVAAGHFGSLREAVTAAVREYLERHSRSP